MGFNYLHFINTLTMCDDWELGDWLFKWRFEEKIKILNKNEDIYLMYFIILTIITCFYRESGLNSPRSYLGLDELIENNKYKISKSCKRRYWKNKWRKWI